MEEWIILNRYIFNFEREFSSSKLFLIFFYSVRCSIDDTIQYSSTSESIRWNLFKCTWNIFLAGKKCVKIDFVKNKLKTSCTLQAENWIPINIDSNIATLHANHVCSDKNSIFSNWITRRIHVSKEFRLNACATHHRTSERIFSFVTFSLGFFFVLFWDFSLLCDLDRFPASNIRTHERKDFFLFCVFSFQMRPFSWVILYSFFKWWWLFAIYFCWSNRFERPAVHFMPSSNQFTDFFNIDRFVSCCVFVRIFLLRFFFAFFFHP